MSQHTTKTTEERLHRASRELSKALTRIGRTDEELRRKLEGILAAGIGAIRQDLA